MFRYKKLGYVALNVSDVEKSTKFYEEMVGLQLVEKHENGPAFFRCSNDHHNVVLYPTNGEPGLKRVGFQMENDEHLELAYQTFIKKGLQPEEVSKEELRSLKQGRTFRIIEPTTGLQMEFYSKMMFMVKDFLPRHTKIQRLDHVVLNVREIDEALDFFVDVLNFRISDQLGDNYWLRCFPNPLHHSFALIQNKETKLHHINFMVTDIDDIGIARNRILNAGVPDVFGPGRHEPSTSIFFYYLDPDGMTLEYSFGMEEIPEENGRDFRMLEPGMHTLDRWGGKPDSKSASTGKIEQKLKNTILN